MCLFAEEPLSWRSVTYQQTSHVTARSAYFKYQVASVRVFNELTGAAARVSGKYRNLLFDSHLLEDLCHFDWQLSK